LALGFHLLGLSVLGPVKRMQCYVQMRKPRLRKGCELDPVHRQEKGKAER
jgi:hypothetical protein